MLILSAQMYTVFRPAAYSYAWYISFFPVCTSTFPNSMGFGRFNDDIGGTYAS
jgi:hypothetical protein